MRCLALPLAALPVTTLPVTALLAALLCAPPVHAEPAATLADAPDWHAARLAEAADGARRIVRIPLVRRSTAWGCVCPDWYIGDSPDVGTDLWLAPVFSPHAQALPAKMPPTGMIIQAEGFYTGKTEEFVWRHQGEVKKRYQMPEFQVLRWRPNRSTDGGRLRTLLAGPQAAETVTPLSDERPWLVIVHTLDLRSKSCTRGAELRRKRLVEMGFSDVEIIDSRQAPKLACCSKMVLIGRFKTRKAARARAAEGRAKKLKTYVRCGW